MGKLLEFMDAFGDPVAIDPVEVSCITIAERDHQKDGPLTKDKTTRVWIKGGGGVFMDGDFGDVLNRINMER